jgi:DNA polymerase-3 subunit chi
VINLRDAAVDGSFRARAGSGARPTSPRAGPLRERWKHYQARGLELKKYDM